jgi:hypothetical protein
MFLLRRACARRHEPVAETPARAYLEHGAVSMHKAAKLTTIRSNAQPLELIEHDVHFAMSSYWPPDKPKPHALSRFPAAARYIIEGPFLAKVAKAAKPAIYRVLSDLQFEGCNGYDCCGRAAHHG